jgi:adenylosuccinate synthase
LQNIYEQEPISYNSVIEEILEYKNLYDEFCCDTQETITTWIKQDKEIIFEGAQGSLLDIDHGTYPFVTSSNTTVGGVLTGLGIGPKNIDRVVGISKAYSTRVGEGPFLTELIDKDGELLASRGNEFGATTGRPRRCGWLDLVALKKSIFMNSVTDLCITKLDVLDEFKQIKVCVSYDHLNKPVYKEFRGWQVSTEGSTSIEQLPDEARFFLDYIERFVECKISIVSTGPKRNQTINNYSF